MAQLVLIERAPAKTFPIMAVPMVVVFDDGDVVRASGDAAPHFRRAVDPRTKELVAAAVGAARNLTGGRVALGGGVHEPIHVLAVRSADRTYVVEIEGSLRRPPRSEDDRRIVAICLELLSPPTTAAAEASPDFVDVTIEPSSAGVDGVPVWPSAELPIDDPPQRTVRLEGSKWSSFLDQARDNPRSIYVLGSTAYAFTFRPAFVEADRLLAAEPR